MSFPQPIFGVSGRPVSVTSVGGLGSGNHGCVKIDLAVYVYTQIIQKIRRSKLNFDVFKISM